MKQLFLSLLALGATSIVWADGHEGDEHDHGDEHAHGEVLREGHADLLVLFEADEGLHLALAGGEEHDHDHDDEMSHDGEGEPHGDDDDDHGHDHGDHLELEDVEIVGGAAAVQAAPTGGAWSFLGGPNQFIYVLPQSEVEGLPFLGLVTEELDAALFAPDSDITLSLLEVEGPGSFALYQVDAFGQPVVFADSTQDEIGGIALPLGGHVHANWAFSFPGEYELTFEVSATAADGSLLASEPQIVTFEIFGHPVYVHEGHADIALSYEPEHGLELSFIYEEEDEHDHEDEAHGDETAKDDDDHGDDHGHDDEHDHEHGEGIHPADVVIVLGGYALTEVTDNAALSFLGAPGDTVYLLGQSEAEGVPFMGWSADELHAEDFMGDPVIELHEVEGPGDVFLYALDAFGGVTVYWDTADAEEDTLTMPTGAHAHYNLAVTAPGIYTLELHAEATLADGTEVDTHADFTLQAGGLEGFLGHFEPLAPFWIEAETGGMLYTAEWPWLWGEAAGWMMAAGEGGPNHIYYQLAAENWLWTSPAVYPYVWSFGVTDWMTW